MQVTHFPVKSFFLPTFLGKKMMFPDAILQVNQTVDVHPAENHRELLVILWGGSSHSSFLGSNLTVQHISISQLSRDCDL